MQKFLKSFEKKIDNITSENPEKIRYGGLNSRMMANLFDMLVVVALVILFLFFFPPEFNTSGNNIPDSALKLIAQHNNKEITDGQFLQQLHQSGYIKMLASKLFSAVIINFLVFGLIVVFLWKKFNATPGKMLFKLKIVDDTTMQEPSISQYIVRFVCYFISAIPFGLGFLIIPLNKRKKALHDYLANTVVIYVKPKNPEWEKKKNKIQLYIFFILLILAIIYLSN
jgi:uncharacterized RDD family membrane protein YckC